MFLFQISLEDKFPILGNRSEEEKIYDKQVREGMSKIGRVAIDFIPLTYLPEMKNEMQKALDNKDKYAFIMATSQTLLFLGLDGVDVLSWGSAKPLTIPTKMAIKTTFKQRIKQVSKYIPEFKVKPKEIGVLDRHIDDALDIIQKGKEQFPELKEMLDQSVKAIDYKDTSNAYLLFNNLGKKVSNVAKDSYELMHNDFIACFTYDKSGMWALNGLNSNQVYGDIALTVYNHSISKAANVAKNKFKDTYIDVVRTGGDEIIVLISNKNLDVKEKAVELFEKELNKNLDIYVGKMDESFAKTFKKYDKTPSHGQIYADGNKFGFTITGESHKEVYTLSEFSGRSETRKLFSEYIDTYLKGNRQHSDYEYLLQISRKKPVFDLNVIKNNEAIDGVVGFRGVLDSNAREIFEKITTINQKGKGDVVQNFVGPSVFNQLGHNVVDNLTSEYAKSIFNTAKKYGFNVNVSQSGPMQLAYKFEKAIDDKTMKKILQESEEVFLKSVKEIGIVNVKSFYKSGKNYTKEISHKLNDDVVNFTRIKKFDEEVTNNVNRVIALSNILKNNNKTLDVLEQISDSQVRSFVNDLPKYVRNIDQLVQYGLEKGKSRGFIEDTINALSGIY